MEFHPEEREEILARRAEKELKNRLYKPQPTPSKDDVEATTAQEGVETTSQGGKEASPLEKRMEKYRKMRKEQKSRVCQLMSFLILRRIKGGTDSERRW